MKSFLIIQTAFLGDVILATSVVEALHQVHPGAKIDFLLRKGNEGLLINHPYIDQLYVWDKKNKKYQDYIRILKRIRASRYDVLINLQRFTSSGILTVLSKAKRTIGFDKNPFSRFFSTQVPHKIQAGIHEVDRNLSIIDHLFPSQTFFYPKLYPQKSDYKKVATYQKSAYICIAPASVWFTKQLPESKWISLIQSVPDHYPIYLIGGPTDRHLCNRIADAVRHPRVYVLAGELSLLASAALVEKALMNYVNDSAPLHIATAMNAPVTAFFCSTVPDFGFGPLSNRSFVVETPHKLSCRPCDLHGKNSCPEKHFNCAHQIILPTIPTNTSNKSSTP